MHYLQDTRIAVLEKALESLGHLTEVGGGDFLRRRMRKEAWPLLAQLLKYGVMTAPQGRLSARKLMTASAAHAPAILARTRIAIVTAIDRHDSQAALSAFSQIPCLLLCSATP